MTGYTIQSGGVLLLSNSAAVNNADRISDSAPITMKGGTFNFSNDAVASTGYSETAGPLLIAVAGNSITTSTASATAGTSSLTFASLARSTGTILNFTNAASLGTSRNSVFFNTPPALDSGNLIGGWAWLEVRISPPTAAPAGSPSRPIRTPAKRVGRRARISSCRPAPLHPPIIRLIRSS